MVASLRLVAFLLLTAIAAACSREESKASVLSANQDKIAFESNRDGNFEIYVMNSNGSSQTRLTFNPSADMLPSWSPDGRRIVFDSSRDGDRNIYVMNADGSNQGRLTDNPAMDIEPKWSPDGGFIAFVSNRDGPYSIYVMNIDGSKSV
jgi:Tol biopolymer transport system component